MASLKSLERRGKRISMEASSWNMQKKGVGSKSDGRMEKRVG